ncbi:hypothetical protein [Sulfuricaulis sp.]|uniref:hypothetical protein n=1 Tax=Sulfuricaulis sp. TaxID=2003553 RepID=UPI0034A40FCD
MPHVDQVPYAFEPVGRTDANRHDSATLRVAPLSANQPLKKKDLPVAAMPQSGGEVWAAYRAKMRPCLVIGSHNPAVDRALTEGTPKNSTAPTVLVAPYYGVDKDSRRAGYSPEFVERVRHCEYPQFVWDRLPITAGPDESILRLDQLQPISAQDTSYKLSEFKLSDGALEIIDELVHWLIWGGVDRDSLIALYRAEIEKTYGA